MAEPEKLKLALGEVIVHWDEDGLQALAAGAETGERPWHLHGEPGEESSALRVLSARFGKQGLLLVAALRPADADGHDAEVPQGLMRDGEGLRALHEVLLSTEYGRSGQPQRIGLEMYEEPDGYALRAAGDAVEVSVKESEGWRREVARLEFRLDGEDGAAVYEIWHRA